MSTTALHVSKRDIILSTLQALQSAIPDDPTFLKRIETLDYCAPELLDSYWQRLYEYLVSQQWEPWTREAQCIWNTARKQYDTLHSQDISTIPDQYPTPL